MLLPSRDPTLIFLEASVAAQRTAVKAEMEFMHVIDWVDARTKSHSLNH